MGVLASRLDPSSDAYRANRAANLELLAELDRLLAQARAGGGQKYVDRHRARGKLLARERVELLLDRDGPFLELSPLAAWGTDFPVGASGVTGVGPVAGVECVVTASDPTVRGGATNPLGLRKTLRAMEIAERNRLPLVQLIESSGADLPTQSQIFIPGGAVFRNLTRLSRAGIPTVALVLGSSTAGGAYVPGLSDHTIMVRGRAKVFLGGPPLVKMATGEQASDEELGGAEMHARISGLADQLAADEHDCLRLGREVIANLSWRKLGPGPTRPADEPVHDPEELLGLAPVDLRVPADVREILARVVDGSRFEECKPLLRHQPVLRLGVGPRLPGRGPRQRRRGAVLRGVQQGGPLHPARQPVLDAAAVPPEHHRLHGRQGLRAAGDHQGRGQDDQRRRQLGACRT